MAILKLKRGSTASHATFTGVVGELTYNTDTKTLVSHDGLTAGGSSYIKVSTLAANNGATHVRANSYQTQDSINQAIRTVDSFGLLGVGNDAAVFQAALTEISATTQTLYIKGNTNLALGNATFTLNSSINIIGLGKRGSSTISWTGTAGTLFNIATAASVHFEDIQFLGPHTGAGTLMSPYVSTSTAGAIISLSGSAGVANSFSSFRKCSFVFGYNAIDLQSAYTVDIDGCYFSGFANMGVNVSNTINEDAGDSTIQGCTFGNSANALACIHQTSSGGLRVINNKMNTAQFGYKLQLAGSVGTSDLVIVGNSIENAGEAGIGLFRTPGQTATFNNIVISSNQIALCQNGILMNSSEVFYSIAGLTGNVLSAINAYGIILDNASDVTILGNVIAGNSGAITGININSAVEGAVISSNKITGFGTPIVNLSTKGVVTQETRTVLTYVSGIDSVVSTNETVIATAKIPKHLLGVNGVIKVSIFGTVTNNTNTKTIRARLGGPTSSIVYLAELTQNDTVSSCFDIMNTSKTSQYTCCNTRFDATYNYVAPISTSVDTTTSLDLVFTVQKEDIADTVLCQQIIVQVLA